MISYELKIKVLQYINSEITCEQLEEWTVPRLHVFLSDPNSEDADIVSVIELGLAEVSDGLRNEEEFRGLLNEELQKIGSWAELLEQDSYLTSAADNIVEIGYEYPGITYTVTVVRFQ